MSAEFFLLLGVIIAGFFFLYWAINKNLNKSTSSDLVEWLKSTNTRMEEQTRTMNDRLETSARVIMGVQRSVGEMSEIGRSMKDLQELLKSPKLRGNIGEQVLKELLGQMLPKSSFHIQYTFKTGSIVDAAITTTAGIIPIDSKFPMENFRKLVQAQTDGEKESMRREFTRDVKKHIDDISRKYLLPDEGTVDFAIMYIPSESVYYEICNIDGLMDYSTKKRVLPVSPSTFYAFLQSVLMSFEGQKIEAQAREILSAIRSIEKDYEKVNENLGVLGKHLGNASNMMSQVTQGFGQLGQKINSTQRLSRETKEEVKKLNPLSD
jgi:DNA recombination protein RmuC